MPSQTKTIMLTTKCTAGCAHCPFSKKDLQYLFLSFEKFESILSISNNQLIVLSGGEPFEHPELSQLLDICFSKKKTIRIATGGFIDISPLIKKLIFLKNHEILQGISLGTDVISSRASNDKLVLTWKKNVNLLIDSNIPFSLTFTIDSDFDLTWLNILLWQKIFKTKPEFLYIRYLNMILLEKWVEKLKAAFHPIKIITDKI